MSSPVHSTLPVPFAASAAPILGKGVRAWAATWRVQWRNRARLDHLLEDGPVVLAFWHEDLAVLGPLHADRSFVGMVSQSRDGERLAQLLHLLGYETVRGSSSRGARAVALAGMRALRSGRSLAIAVDGPRGPRRTVQPGAVALSAWARCPLVLVGCSATPSLRLGSWDRQRIPMPFARVHVAYQVAAPSRDEGPAASTEARQSVTGRRSVQEGAFPRSIHRCLVELGLTDPSAPEP